MIADQPVGVKGLATASFACNSEIHHVKLARLGIAAGTAVVLIGLYLGTKHFFSVESFAAEQSRVYHLDIGEACMRGAEPPPVLAAREGDRVVLTVASLYSGELYLHGLETETSITPGAETTVTFTAEHAGRYYLHLHGDDEDHTHTELAVLEVAPR